ncbi:hypothetical protein CCR75_003107 [Bremia lactucae]|uniref:Uncharacterized protein n=1 Tax=Bremia lactucae TaxID=4779 RepID=A0A976FHE8_BRELC|nr:hypothetical protein CCR75_003107 [Bremia lactucae]
MKREQERITTFFQRKQTRRISVGSIDSHEGDDATTVVSISSSNKLYKAQYLLEDARGQDEPELHMNKRKALICREAREDLVGILQFRELVGCASDQRFISGRQHSRRRRKQQLVRWALSHFQRLPLKLHLSPHWEQAAGQLSTENFYASCLEFDAQGILLAAGASNGIVAIYDFDDVFHHSLNIGQKPLKNKMKETREDLNVAERKMHPIHTIFTPYEVKCIRWNPMNEDEIACSFTNRNEIYVFDLRKFPDKPYKVLKSLTQPSSGYNDFVYLHPIEITMPNSRHSKKPNIKQENIIAGDMDGAIRMWDARYPLRPVFSFLAGSLPINALVLSPNKQLIVCGNEAGMLMLLSLSNGTTYLQTYDIKHKVIPAFGSKPVPQRKASFNILDMIKPYLSAALLESVLLSSRYGSPGIISMRLVPESEAHVLCQLRNDWVVVLDYLNGSIFKLYTLNRKVVPREKLKADPSPTVLAAPPENEISRNLLPRSFRNSWLSSHRCAGTMLFDKSIMCTGIHDAASLNVIDLHQLRTIRASFPAQIYEPCKEHEAKPNEFELQAVERLDRFQISTNNIITAVTAHPNQCAVICGGENMTLQIMGVIGRNNE